MVDLVEDQRTPQRSNAAGRRRRKAPAARAKLVLTHVEGLDGLRVAGALAVVIYHVMGAVLGSNPPAGVIMPPAAFTFFVISGFVIYRPFAAGHLNRQRMPDLGRFFTSRAIRVLPLWWVAVAVYLAVDGTGRLHTPAQWIATLTLFQFAIPAIRFAVIGPAWALSVEWIFYLTAPFLALGLRAINRSWLPRVDPVKVQLGALLPMLGIAAVVAPLRPFVAIIVGMLLAIASVRQAMTGTTPQWLDVLRSPGTALVTTAGAWVVLLVYPYRPGLSVQWVEQDPAVVLIWLAVATAWFAPVAFGPGTGIVTSRLRSPWAARLGLLTYGLYLWHDLILRQLLEHLGLDAHLGAMLYLTLLGAIAMTAFTFYVIERPLMSLRERFISAAPPKNAGARPRPPAPTPARSQAKAQAQVPSTVGVPPTVAADPSTVPDRASAPARGWITSIDGLRVIGAVCVITFHVAAEKTIPARYSQSLGALLFPVFSVFFLVSGYVLYRPWAMAQARMSLGDGVRPSKAPDGGAFAFWLRRILRVYPVYWVVQGAALAISGTGNLHTVTDWIQMITLFPLPNFDVVGNHGLGVIVWTMVIELAFYTVLPIYSRIVTWSVDRGTPFVRAQVLPLGLGFVLMAWGASTTIRVFAVPVLLVVGMGIAGIDAWQRTTRQWVPIVRTISRNPLIALPVTLVWWAIGTAVSTDDDPDLLFRTYLGVHLAAMVCVSIVLFLPAVFGPARSPYRRFLASTPMRLLGPLTFGIYLWHYPVVRETGKRIDLPLPALFLWTVIVAPVMALTTYKLVEQPIERFRHRYLGRTSTRPPEPVPHRTAS